MPVLHEEKQKLRGNKDISHPINVYFTPKELKYAVHCVPGWISLCEWEMFINHFNISVEELLAMFNIAQTLSNVEKAFSTKNSAAIKSSKISDWTVI